MSPVTESVRRRGDLLGVLVALLLLAASGSAFGAPVWRLVPAANSTVAAGDTLEYFVNIANIGDVPMSGPFTFTVTLPAEMTSVAASFSGGAFSCTGNTGTSLITCISSNPLAPLGTFGKVGYTARIRATVAPFAAGVLTTTMEIQGGGADTVVTADPTLVSATPPDFGVDAFDGSVNANSTGDPFTQAAGHPYDASTSIDFNSLTNPDPFKGPVWPVEPVKDVLVDLPPGLVGNPTVLAQCTAGELANSNSALDVRELCPPAAQVGTAMLRKNEVTNFGNKVLSRVPVFNMVPPPNVPARLGFNVFGSVVTLDAQLRSGSDYGLSVNARNVPEGLPVAGTTLTIWGVPADPSHDLERACPGEHPIVDGGPTCKAGVTPKAFWRLPTVCTPAGSGLISALHIDSWAHPDVVRSATFESHLPASYPFPPDQWGPKQGPTGCEKVPFDPTLSAQPSAPALAATPSAFAFDVTLPQNDEPDAIGEADLKRAVVTLPAGVRVSPSAAGGLGACTPAQIGFVGTGFPEPNPIHFDTSDPTCPNNSKIGTLQIDTPLLSEPLSGSVYLASPHDNPFDTLIALYLVAKGPGLIVKLPGHVAADPVTGQLTATFDHNPQVPFKNLHLQFPGGSRAPLVTPAACGTYATQSRLTSWSGKTVLSESPFTLTSDQKGTPCSAHGFTPTLIAGTRDPVAGASTPFLLSLTRSDQDQELRTLSVGMPGGLLGRIASVTLCPDAAAQAGTCQDDAKIGSVTVGAGPGANPFYITNGRAYITGPYKGAPFGLSIVVPAVAGPFDLGDVVVRAAIYVDRTTAQLHVVSDPLPTILQGIPLDVRDVRVAIDRPRFIVNPTSCAVKRVTGTLSSTEGAVARLASRFRVHDCADLRLAPKLTLAVGAKRHTAANASTPLTATITQTPGQSNLRSVSVTLPSTLNARLPIVNKACTLEEFHAGQCEKARAGSAVAVTPLLRNPLRGSVYFVKTDKPGTLPNLMVALRGQVDLDLTGKISIPGGKVLSTTFGTIPDAPITKFTLSLVSGKSGPLGTISNLCTAKARKATASVVIVGHNGMTTRARQRLHINGCPKARAQKARR